MWELTSKLTSKLASNKCEHFKAVFIPLLKVCQEMTKLLVYFDRWALLVKGHKDLVNARDILNRLSV